MTKKPILIAALVLGAFAILGVGLVSATYEATKERIAYNKDLFMLRKLQDIVPADTVDNDMITDCIVVHNPELLGSDNTIIYVGEQSGAPVAVVLTPIVPDGYSGPIELLVAVRKDRSLGGVRVLSHKETPGLGDKIEEKKSFWIRDFKDKSLENPPLDQWKVRRDGGHFDQFTGATITPRSIVKSVKKALLFVQQQGEAIYKKPPPAEKRKCKEKRDSQTVQ